MFGSRAGAPLSRQWLAPKSIGYCSFAREGFCDPRGQHCAGVIHYRGASLRLCGSFDGAARLLAVEGDADLAAVAGGVETSVNHHQGKADCNKNAGRGPKTSASAPALDRGQGTGGTTIW